MKTQLPGLRLALGVTLVWLTLIVLIPLAALVLKASDLTAAQWVEQLGSERIQAALLLSFKSAWLAAVCNAVLGLVLAWVLVRQDFVGKRWLDAAVDVPFALPTAVAGIAWSALLAENGWYGQALASWGVTLAYTEHAIVVALVFVGLPFVVRSLVPVLQDQERELEEAASTLGARPWQTFWHVVLPALAPAWLTGFGLAFGRGLGEYGSVVFVAGNIPLASEIAPLVIIGKLEQYDVVGATALASVMMVSSLVLLLALNAWQRQQLRRKGVGR